MNGPGNKITFLQVFMMFSLMNGLASHVIVNPMILQSSGRDSWIAGLATGALFLIWIVLLYWIMRRTGQQEWKTWLSRRINPFAAWILLFPVCLQLYLIGGMTVIHTSTWHVTNYLPTTPKFLLVTVLILFCTAMSVWGIQVIAIVSGVLLPIVTILGIFVSASNHPMKNYDLLRPVLEHGVEPVLGGMVYAGAGVIEFLVLIVIQHHMKSKVRLWQLFAYVLFSTIVTVGPLVGAITEFGPKEAALQMTSPYEQWRLVQVGQFIEHVDFFSIFQWLAGACVRISLSVFLVVELLSLKKQKNRVWAILIVMVSYAVISLFPINEYSFYLWMYKYYMPISLIVFFVLSLIWMVIALFKGSSKRREAA